jgi:large subunit ribosomal protein L10
MALNLEQKKAMVQEVAAVAQGAHSAVAADYTGISAGVMDTLRVKAREQGVYLRVVKNTLARRAVEGTSFECMSEGLEGPLVLGFSQDDPGAAARVFKDFSKIHKNLVVKVVALGGKLVSPADLDRVANLPTRDQAISILMATMKAPAQKFVSTLNEVPSKLARVLAAIRDTKQ